MLHIAFVNPFLQNKSFSSKGRNLMLVLSKIKRITFPHEFSTGCGKRSGKPDYS